MVSEAFIKTHVGYTSQIISGSEKLSKLHMCCTYTYYCMNFIDYDVGLILGKKFCLVNLFGPNEKEEIVRVDQQESEHFFLHFGAH